VFHHVLNFKRPNSQILDVIVSEMVECEAGLSAQSSAEVKNAWNCTSTHPYVFMAWFLVKYRDNFVEEPLLLQPWVCDRLQLLSFSCIRFDLVGYSSCRRHVMPHILWSHHASTATLNSIHTHISSSQTMLSREISWREWNLPGFMYSQNSAANIK
jgi:hypothetical protein